MIVRASRDDGVALIAAVMAMAMMLALSSGLILVTMTETHIASSYLIGIQTLYAAEAGIEIVVGELRDSDEWAEVAAGSTMSRHVDGSPPGIRTLPDRTQINLMDEVPPDAETRRWRLFAYGPLAGMLGGTTPSPDAYVIVWVARNPVENPPVLTIFATAYGPRGARRSVEESLRRTVPGAAGAETWEIERLSWRER